MNDLIPYFLISQIFLDLPRGLEMMHPRTGIEQRPRLFRRQQYVTLGNERKFDPAILYA